MKKRICATVAIIVAVSNVNVFAETVPVIDYQFKSVSSERFVDDRAIVSYDDEAGEEEHVGVINKSGEFIIPDNKLYADGIKYSDGIFVCYDKNTKDTEIYDKAGKLLATSEAEDNIFIHGFHDGLALVEKIETDENGIQVEDKYENLAKDPIGYIDKTGKLVLPIKYDYAYDFNGGYAVVDDDPAEVESIYNEEGGATNIYDKFSNRKIINKQGEVLPIPNEIAIVGTRFSEGLITVMNQEGLYGYIDYSGQLVIPCTLKRNPGDFHNGMAKMETTEKMGTNKLDDHVVYINKEGKRIPPASEYSLGSSFSQGLAIVSIHQAGYNGPFFIDKEGNKVFDSSFYDKYSPSWGNNFSEGLACVWDLENKMYSYVNIDGEEVIPSQPGFSNNFYNGLAVAVKDNLSGYIKNPYVTSLRINGKHVMTDTDAINMEGKTMVPIEETAKYFGVDTTVDIASNGVYFKKGDIYAENFIGDKKLNTNSKKTELTTPIVVKDGVAYIYIRDLADIFGYATSYEAGTSTVVLEG